MCARVACDDQKAVPEPLELELWVFMNHHMGAELSPLQEEQVPLTTGFFFSNLAEYVYSVKTIETICILMNYC